MRVALTLAILSLCGQAVAQTNMIENGNFEAFSHGTCPPSTVFITGQAPAGTGWAITNQSPDHLCSYTGGGFGFESPHQYRADVAHGGNGYIFIYGFASPYNPESYAYTLATPLQSGITYTFSFWGKNPANYGGGTFLLKGASGTTYVTQNLSNASNWTSYSFSFTPTVSEPSIIFTAAAANQGVAIDDVALMPNSPLSLHLHWFNGVARGADAVLEWEMVEEHGLRSFSIERSLDGRGFQQVGEYETAPGFGNRYTLTDPDIPAEQTIFYRLRVLEKTGNSRFSRVLSLRRATDAPKHFALSPNPARNALRIDGVAKGGSVRVFATDGRLVLAQNDVADGGVLDVSHLARGTYFLHHRAGEAVMVERFVKE